MKKIKESNGSGLELSYLHDDRNFPTPFVTFIVKGTFDIVPDGPSVQAAKQRLITGDQRHMDEIGRSLSWSSDTVPFKPHSDFLIHGTFYQPDGIAAPTGDAWFEYGPLWKRLRIFGSRTVRQSPGQPPVVTAPLPIKTLPLRWEYSTGGLRNRDNPMGMGGDVTETEDGDRYRSLPLIEDPRALIRTAADRPAAVNFAPVPHFFQERRRKLGTRDQRWAMFRAPMPPDDFDPSYYNAAPRDQQAGNYPRGDERLVLGNLHPTIPQLTTWLPSVLVRLAVLRLRDGVARAEAVEMNLDTVVALPDDNQLVLVWRGRCPLQSRDDADELTWVAVETEKLGGPPLDPPLPVRLMEALAAEGQKAQAAAQAARDAEAAAQAATDKDVASSLAQARQALAGVDLPDELAALMQAEDDPEVLFEHLGKYIDDSLADLEKQLSAMLPPASD